ncbi:MAG: ExbD/TolR family protein [Candidatus Methylacidiphilales bacterium]
MKLRRSVQALQGPLDITAMIDVVLLLLIFFMLNSSFVLHPGVEITPPQGMHAGVRDAHYVVNITGQTPPRMFFNDQIVTMENLKIQLGKLGRRSEEMQIIIRADKEVQHGVVTEIMNAAIQAGLTVIIATQGS